MLELHCGGGLVDFLAAGACAFEEGLGDCGFVDCWAWREGSLAACVFWDGSGGEEAGGGGCVERKMWS